MFYTMIWVFVLVSIYLIWLESEDYLYRHFLRAEFTPTDSSQKLGKETHLLRGREFVADALNCVMQTGCALAGVHFCLR